MRKRRSVGRIGRAFPTQSSRSGGSQLFFTSVSRDRDHDSVRIQRAAVSIASCCAKTSDAISPVLLMATNNSWFMRTPLLWVFQVEPTVFALALSDQSSDITAMMTRVHLPWSSSTSSLLTKGTVIVVSDSDTLLQSGQWYQSSRM